MRIQIKVKPNSKQKKIEKSPDNQYILWIRSPAKEGLANKEVILSLSEYFDVAKTKISIIKGAMSKNKIIEIES